ncbi:hypothetical protein AB0P05_33370 [Streptomyces flaveolus]|uniref:hypothetical protein n=1 Tax=Streptomyces flaveolus TaxID=67297 RepID=UPI0034397AC2
MHRTGQPDGLAREFSPLAGGSSAAGMSEQPWTIESIRDALGNPVLGQRFLSEINRAPAHELLSVFARWERIAKDTIVAVRCGRELAAAEARGEEPAGEWVDATDRVLADTERIRTRGAA